jgi:uncharacterized membrane protein YcjF (UPF0283 family)
MMDNGPEPAEAPTQNRDFIKDLKGLWRMVRYFVIIAACVLAVLFLGQLYAAYDMLAAVPPQPWIGVGFVVVVVVLLGLLVGIPLLRFLRLSVVAKPPTMPERTEDVRPAHIAQRLKYLDEYLDRMKRNPLLEEQASAFAAAGDTIADFSRRARSGGAASLQPLIDEIAAFEQDEVDRLLEPLDDHVGSTIRTEALGVGVATALSMNGTMDAFIVLWRQVNMVSRIGKIYYGRPGPLGSIKLVGEVLGATVASAYLDDLTEAAGGMLTSLLGGVAGAVAGPMVNGTANALVTVRVGYLAKARCRSFEAWTGERRAHAMRRALAFTREQSKEIAAALVSTVGDSVGGGVARAAGSVKDKLKNAWKSISE